MIKCESCKGKRVDWKNPKKPCKSCAGTGNATDWKGKPKK